MPAQASAGGRSTVWIVSPLADVVLLVASPLAIVPIVTLAARQFSAETIFLFVASFASLGHHLPGFLRAYGDPALFRRFRWRFLLAPPLVAAAAIFFAVEKMHGLDLLLMLWATWHIVMQTYGMMRIYDLKRGIRDSVTARLDLAVCMAVFAAGIIFSQTRIFSILTILDQVGLPLLPTDTLVLLQWCFGAAIGIVLFAFAVNQVVQSKNRGVSWPKLALLLTTGWLYWICGSVSTSLLVGVAMFEIFHALQYDTLVWSYNRRSADRAGDRFGPLRFLFASGWLPLACYIAAIAAFGSIKWVVETSDPSTVKMALLTLLFTSTTLHFYFDGFIWKVSEAGTQRNLGIEGGGQRPNRVPALIHTGKWAIAGAAGVSLFWVEANHDARSPAEEQSWTALALQWTPDVPELLVKSGELLLAGGDPARAATAARRAVSLRPASADGYLLLAQSLAETHDFASARDAAEQAAALDPTSAKAVYMMGLADVQLQDFPGAEKTLRRAVVLDPESAQTHFQLGNVYFLTRRAELAEQSYRRAVALSPYLADGHGNLGAALLQLGRVAEAKQSLQAALEIGDNPRTHYNLGLILLIEGNTAQARSQLKQAENRGQSLSPQIRQAAGL